MARTIALIQTAAPAHLLADMPRKMIVLGCAVALILAGRPLPF
ncbi:MAG: hypothetical protein NTX28_17550 [Novosphingobium sp.]|nr:hypothetical protein [Novosphingobium sp.]